MSSTEHKDRRTAILQLLALRAEYHESGSLSSMEARRSKPDLSMRLHQSRNSQFDPIPAFYPIVLSGIHGDRKSGRRGHALSQDKAVSMTITTAKKSRRSPLCLIQQ